jgi:hypothetical protein
MHQNKEKIFEHLRKLALVVGTEEPQERLITFTEILGGFPEEKIRQACIKWISEEKGFPPISFFIKTLHGDNGETPEELATELAAFLTKQIPHLNMDDLGDCKGKLGESGYNIIEKFIGLHTFITTTYNQIPNLRAHLRDVIVSQIKRNPEIKRDIRLLTREENDTPRLENTTKEIQRTGHQ